MFTENSERVIKRELTGISIGLWSKRGSFFLIMFLAAIILNGPCAVRTADAAENQPLAGKTTPKFRWVSAGTAHAVPRVTAETKTIVPIEVEVGGSVTEVLFVISPQFRAFGIRIENPSSNVTEGTAHARVVFNIASGMPLGRHNLVIQVFEKDGKTAIVSGTVPFIILPNDMECLC
ncbi:MAG: hypothetical protein ACYC69_08945 [Thermodesulfovibrionales bacterium]